MKCIRSTEGVITRVHEAQAEVKVKTGDWMFIPKSEWKKMSYVEKVRNVNVRNPELVASIIVPVEKKKKPPKTTKQDKKKKK